jgi:hypothetical protein
VRKSNKSWQRTTRKSPSRLRPLNRRGALILRLEKLPPSLKTYTLPPSLIYQMPKLKRYTYLKLKGQVLIVNPMSGKIPDRLSQKTRRRC